MEGKPQIEDFNMSAKERDETVVLYRKYENQLRAYKDHHDVYSEKGMGGGLLITLIIGLNYTGATIDIIFRIPVFLFIGALGGGAIGSIIYLLFIGTKPRLPDKLRNSQKKLDSFNSALRDWEYKQFDDDVHIVSKYGEWLEKYSVEKMLKSEMPDISDLPFQKEKIECSISRLLESDRVSEKMKDAALLGKQFLKLFKEEEQKKE